MIYRVLQQIDNTLIITIPAEEAERLQLQAGQVVKVEIEPQNKLSQEEIDAAFEESWRRNEAGYRYLAGR